MRLAGPVTTLSPIVVAVIGQLSGRVRRRHRSGAYGDPRIRSRQQPAAPEPDSHRPWGPWVATPIRTSQRATVGGSGSGQPHHPRRGWLRRPPASSHRHQQNRPAGIEPRATRGERCCRHCWEPGNRLGGWVGRSSRQSGSAPLAPATDNGPAGTGSHTPAETMFAGPLAYVWLVGALHRSTPGGTLGVIRKGSTRSTVDLVDPCGRRLPLPDQEGSGRDVPVRLRGTSGARQPQPDTPSGDQLLLHRVIHIFHRLGYRCPCSTRVCPMPLPPDRLTAEYTFWTGISWFRMGPCAPTDP